MLRRWWSGNPSRRLKSALSCNNGLQEPRNDPFLPYASLRLPFQPLWLWISPESVLGTLNKNGPGFPQRISWTKWLLWAEVQRTISRDRGAVWSCLTLLKCLLKSLLKFLLKSSELMYSLKYLKSIKREMKTTPHALVRESFSLKFGLRFSLRTRTRFEEKYLIKSGCVLWMFLLWSSWFIKR